MYQPGLFVGLVTEEWPALHHWDIGGEAGQAYLIGAFGEDYLLQVLDCWAPACAAHRRDSQFNFMPLRSLFEITNARKDSGENRRYIPHGGAPFGNNRLFLFDQEIPV